MLTFCHDRVQDVDPVALASACKALFFYEAGRNEYIDSNGPPQKLETVRDSGKQDGRSILGEILQYFTLLVQVNPILTAGQWECRRPIGTNE